MQSLITFYQFVKEITANNSRNYKLAILNKYSNDENIKFYLNYLYSPYIITGISDKKLKRSVPTDCTTTLNTIPDILNYAKEHNTGSDKDLSIIFTNRDTIIENSLNENEYQYAQQYYEFFNKLLTKNLQLGVDAKSINKIIPNLIPTFSLQLANKYFDNPTIVEGKKFSLTTKIDGGRIIAIKKNGKAKFYTRQGQEYEGLVDLKEEMENYMPDNLCLDGEITLLDPYKPSDYHDFIEEDLFDPSPRIYTCTKLSSKEQYKETMKITRRDGEKHGVKMLVFDCMTADEFESQRCDKPYFERRETLNRIFKNPEYKNKYFELLPVLYEGTDTSEITNWLNRNIANGEEGVMINIYNAPYDFKRTSNLLKVKRMQTMDLEIVGYEEGTNANEGKLGAFVLRYRDGNTVKVGSGFSKELREEVWKDPESYIGKIIEVQYFEETENQGGGKGLRFPVFIDFRTDKDEPDF